jgi:hypothetical protein
VNDSIPDKHQRTRDAIERVVAVARRGQARYRQGTAALGTWLRSHLFRQGGEGWRTHVSRSLQHTLADRRLRQRQRVYHNGGGHHSTSAARSLHRAAEALRRENSRNCPDNLSN